MADDPFTTVVSQGMYGSRRAVNLYSCMSQPCLTCLICKKRLDALSLVEHDEEVCRTWRQFAETYVKGGRLYSPTGEPSQIPLHLKLRVFRIYRTARTVI